MQRATTHFPSNPLTRCGWRWLEISPELHSTEASGVPVWPPSLPSSAAHSHTHKHTLTPVRNLRAAWIYFRGVIQWSADQSQCAPLNAAWARRPRVVPSTALAGRAVPRQVAATAAPLAARRGTRPGGAVPCIQGRGGCRGCAGCNRFPRRPYRVRVPHCQHCPGEGGAAGWSGAAA